MTCQGLTLTRTTPSVFAVLLLLASGGCAGPGDGQGPARAAGDVTALAGQYIDAYFQTFPEAATFAGIADAPHDRLSNISPEARAQWYATEDRIHDALARIDASSIPAVDAAAVTSGFLTEVLRNARDFRTCRMELWNVSPTYTGWPALIGGLANLQAVEPPEQRDAAIRRFAQLALFLNQEVANLREGLAMGYRAPRDNVEVSIRQVDALATQPLADSPFIAMAAKADDAGFRTRLEALERDEIRPAIATYRDFLRASTCLLRATRSRWLPTRMAPTATARPCGITPSRLNPRRFTGSGSSRWPSSARRWPTSPARRSRQTMWRPCCSCCAPIRGT
jgi:uncharacterized protein (DUF885 family)